MLTPLRLDLRQDVGMTVVSHARGMMSTEKTTTPTTTTKVATGLKKNGDAVETLTTYVDHYVDPPFSG